MNVAEVENPFDICLLTEEVMDALMVTKIPAEASTVPDTE